MTCVLVSITPPPFVIAETTDPVRFEARSPVHIKLSGDTNINRWEMSGTEVYGALEIEWPLERLESLWNAWREIDYAVASPSLDNAMLPVRISFRVPARSLQGRYPRMQKNLLEAIRASKHPFIFYEFIGLDGPPVLTGSADSFVLDVPARGHLILAGKTNVIHHATRMHIHHLGHINLTGRLALNMSDYDVEPPVALFGLVKAYPEFEVDYRFPIKLLKPPADDHLQDTDTR